MQVDTQNDPYVDCEFVAVTCSDCKTESNGFMYKEHLDGTQTVEYIKEITGYRVDNEDGGLRCKKCDRKNRAKRVSGVPKRKYYKYKCIRCDHETERNFDKHTLEHVVCDAKGCIGQAKRISELLEEYIAII